MIRLLLPIALLALGGCATITRGTHDVLIVESEPSGANVAITPNGGDCTTPCSMKLKRKSTYQVEIHRDGYEIVKLTVQPQIVGAGAAGMAGNVLVGGVIGAVVDGTSGAMKDLKPNPVSVHLVKIEPSTTPAAIHADAPSGLSTAVVSGDATPVTPIASH